MIILDSFVLGLGFLCTVVGVSVLVYSRGA